MLRERQRTKIKSGKVLMPQRTNHAPRGKVRITVQGSRLPYIAIQGQAAAYIPWISGSYSNVVGLPLYETAQLLAACADGSASSIPRL